MKRMLCLFVCLLLSIASIPAWADESPNVADVLDDIFHLSPKERAQLIEMADLYMSAMGEKPSEEPAEAETASGEKFEGDGFSTPEEAAMQYITGLKERDINKMLRAFAVETYVDHFDFRMLLEHMGAWTMSLDIALPNEPPMYRDMNVAAYYGKLAQRISYSLFGFRFEESDLDFRSVLSVNNDFGNAQKAYEFFLQERTYLLETISDVAFVDPVTFVSNERHITGERAVKNQERLRQRMGADELRILLATLKMDGKDYFFSCDAARYGDRWFLYAAPGQVAAIMGHTPLDFVLQPLE